MDPLYVITVVGIFVTMVSAGVGIVWRELMSQRTRLHALEQSKAAAELGLRLLEILGPKK